MYDIVGIGASLYDTLMVVPKFPGEDTKMMASRTMGQGGGPCATALAAASRLGAKTAYIGVMGDDAAGDFMKKDLEKYGVDTGYVQVKKGYLSYMSFILLNEETGSRTCIWSKGDLPVTELREKDLEAIRSARVLHLDGNHLEAALMGAAWAKRFGVRVSMDAGGNYPGVEKLLPYVDYLIPSEEFACRFTGETDAQKAARRLYLEFSPEVLIITQGSRGGFLYDGQVHRYPVFHVPVMDSNGAGDVFHGAFISSYINGMRAEEAARFASAVSALKCGSLGGRRSVPDRQTALRFMEKKQTEQGEDVTYEI